MVAVEHEPVETSSLGAAGADDAEEADATAGPRSNAVLVWKPDRNSVAEALFVRICRAIEGKEDFRVYIILPIHPDGPIRTQRAVQLVLYWQQRTISRGKYSLLERLARRFPGVDLNQYIEFFALRKYDYLEGKPVTEQVYVHSKLMIVDDRLVILGSANINDRSMYGDRDSEVAMVITGGDRVVTRMAGRPWRSTVYAHTLRRHLMEEHLGILPDLPGTNLPNSAGPSTSEGAQPGSQMPEVLTQSAPRIEAGAPSIMATRLTPAYPAQTVTPGPLYSYSAADMTPAGGGSGPTQIPSLPSLAGTEDASLPPTTPSIIGTAVPLMGPDTGIETVLSTSAKVQQCLAGPPADLCSACKHHAALSRCPVCKGEGPRAHPVDPVAPGFYNDVWRTIARTNTRIFDHVFPFTIQNGIKTVADWRARDKAQDILNPGFLPSILGKVVLFPKDFLEEEDLSSKRTEKESLLPEKVFQ
jgi:hypothetical protein